MGRGNVCTYGRCEGLYYVDYDLLNEYRRNNQDGTVDFCKCREINSPDYVLDEEISDMNRCDFEYALSERLLNKFKSFSRVDKWISNSRRALLENRLFYIVAEDNEWSLAVELIEKDVEEVGLQMGLYKKYLKALEEILLDMNGEVGVYTGAWTSGVIRK